MTTLPMPENLVAGAEEAGRTEWLARLPDIVGRVATRWELEVGPPYQPGGQTAWVAPARRAHGAGSDGLVLKVMWRHTEALHEAEALRAWDGAGAVRVFAAEALDDETDALLLEECRPGTTLSARPEPEQDTVVAGILRQLWVEPAPEAPFRPLQAMCDDWADDFEEEMAAGRCPLDPGVARAGIALYRGLPGTAERHVLLCTDLHAGNILAAERRPWLAIDPKPYVGDPTYDPVQHMLNCEGRLLANPRGFCDRIAGLLDLDRERLVDWLFARCVQESPDWSALGPVAALLAPG